MKALALYNIGTVAMGITFPRDVLCSPVNEVAEEVSIEENKGVAVADVHVIAPYVERDEMSLEILHRPPASENLQERKV